MHLYTSYRKWNKSPATLGYNSLPIPPSHRQRNTGLNIFLKSARKTRRLVKMALQVGQLDRMNIFGDEREKSRRGDLKSRHASPAVHNGTLVECKGNHHSVTWDMKSQRFTLLKLVSLYSFRKDLTDKNFIQVQECVRNHSGMIKYCIFSWITMTEFWPNDGCLQSLSKCCNLFLLQRSFIFDRNS